MTRKRLIIAGLILACVLGAYLITPVLRIRITDTDGLPIAYAKVTVSWSSFRLRDLLSYGLRAEETSYSREEKTDANGECKVWGVIQRFVSVSVDGYYRGTSDEPDKFVLRKKNPIPMYVKNAWFYLPADDGDFGYDLFEGDLVAPYGVGKRADFVFSVNSTNSPIKGKKSVKLNITFSDPNDGIQPLFMSNSDNAPRSEYRLPFTAPESGYFPSLEAADSNTIGKWYRDKSKLPLLWYWTDSFHPLNPRDRVWMEEINYFFKVRSDAIGYACYGFIRGFFRTDYNGKVMVEFTYLVNPAGTRNIEFDPNHNLIKRLGRYPPETKLVFPF